VENKGKWPTWEVATKREEAKKHGVKTAKAEEEALEVVPGEWTHIEMARTNKREEESTAIRITKHKRKRKEEAEEAWTIIKAEENPTDNLLAAEANRGIMMMAPEEGSDHPGDNITITKERLSTTKTLHPEENLPGAAEEALILAERIETIVRSSEVIEIIKTSPEAAAWEDEVAEERDLSMTNTITSEEVEEATMTIRVIAQLEVEEAQEKNSEDTQEEVTCPQGSSAAEEAWETLETMRGSEAEAAEAWEEDSKNRDRSEAEEWEWEATSEEAEAEVIFLEEISEEIKEMGASKEAAASEEVKTTSSTEVETLEEAEEASTSHLSTRSSEVAEAEANTNKTLVASRSTEAAAEAHDSTTE
jgi:hypothetical protein